MKLSNLKVSTQLYLGFGIILAFMFVLGLLTWRDTNSIYDETVGLYNHALLVQRALNTLESDVQKYRVENRVYLLSLPKVQQQEAVVNDAHLMEEADQQFLFLYNNFKGSKSALDEAHNAFLLWKGLEDEVRNEVQNGNQGALRRIDMHGDLGKVRAELSMAFHRLDAYNQNNAQEILSKINALNRSMTLQLIITFLIILIISLVIIFVISRNILTPLRTIRDASTRFREGDLTARSAYVSTNAFGILSHSFNELANTIETELTLNVHVAQLAGVMLREEDAHRFGHALIEAFINHTEAIMGALFLLNEEKTFFEPFESIGLNKEAYRSFSALHREGEFGVALSTKQMQHIKSIPKDSRMMFSTVSGDFVPREIITIPIVVKNEIVAILSLASIRAFSQESLRLLQSVLVTLNARMEGILAYRQMILIANQLEIQNTELESQKRELAAQASELTEQNMELTMQKKQLDEANKMKNSFLSSMSHELRTPLNSVIALSNVLSRRLTGKIADDEYSYIEVIERNGKQLLELINDILDLSRIEAGKEEMNLTTFHINDLVGEVIEALMPQAKQKKIKLLFKPDETLPEITNDDVKCRHILQNIIANAIKFTEKGKVEVLLSANESSVQINVMDTGIGINKDFIPHLFDEFRQADGSTSRKFGGTGLGLAIAKKYADMIGASIKVASEEGEGSVFTVFLPLKSPAVTPETKPADPMPFVTPVASHQEESSVNPSSKTILIVEDTEAIAIQLHDILQAEGYRICVAHNGQEAIEQVYAQKPDAMILDLMMPEVDGFEVLRRIRSDQFSERLPVVILTAKYVTSDELAILKHNNIFQLIRKGDINKVQLLETVRQSMMPRKEIKKEQPKQDHPKQLQIPINEKAVVLVVEDNPDNRFTIKVLLSNRYTVLDAEDGLQGVRLAQLHLPQLILMDIALPGLNGIEAMRQLKQDAATQHIPVIAVSASAMKGDRETFLAEGFDDYISKPIDSAAFEETIQKWISR
ncbi:MAG: response regulator [Microbacter sp.]